MTFKHFIFSSLLIISIFILLDTFAVSNLINNNGFTKSRSLRRNRDSVLTILNNCPYTVWTAVVLADPEGGFYGGGDRHPSGDISAFIVPAGKWSGRVWGRTNCSFDPSGRGHCQTGDCDGVLDCNGYGAPPYTLAEISLDATHHDILQISLLTGFNIPIKIIPKTTSSRCSGRAKCTADINRKCPGELRAPGGCNHPCTVFETDEYCCPDSSRKCGATNYSKVFKDLCPDAYSYPNDVQGRGLKCPGRTRYDIVFCPP